MAFTGEEFVTHGVDSKVKVKLSKMSDRGSFYGAPLYDVYVISPGFGCIAQGVIEAPDSDRGAFQWTPHGGPYWRSELYRKDGLSQAIMDAFASKPSSEAADLLMRLDVGAHHERIVGAALEATAKALRSARRHGRRTDCLEAAVRSLESALRCVQWENEEVRREGGP